MFNKILIANRGEIALRIIRACKELGIHSVAIFSEADADSLPVKFADESVCIGSASSTASYLNIPRIISAAELTNVDAIHPGYGFLAENTQFADICESCNIKFIGPSSEMIQKMGDKANARQMMNQAGIPIIPGSQDVVESLEQAKQITKEIGCPIIIKAVAGGGGKGMRIVNNESELESAFITAQTEAQSAFGNPAVYIEKYIQGPRHIEFQVLGDQYGNLVHLGERDCTVQRRYQKLIEETPSPAVDDELRELMGNLAIKGAKCVNYIGAGTLEFLLDADRNFYFMEMNTRIQVEHPITELVTNVDIVKEQIRIAAGEKLSFSQTDITIHGHAIECRINAEDSTRGFIPSPGRITDFHFPGGPGIRIDTHIFRDYVVSPYYDSMIAKLIAYGNNRDEAISRMARALSECVIEGVATTIPFHQRIIKDKRFIEGNIDTSFAKLIEQEMDNKLKAKT